MKGCQVCSSDKHPTENCPLIGRTRITDSAPPQRAFLTLPTQLQVKQSNNDHFDVVSTIQMPKGTQFGPFEAPKNKKFNPNCTYKLPIFHKSRILHYLDTTNLSKCNWMSLVQFTTSESLRNTICYQLKSEIFFSVVENVEPGQSLIVGYSPGYTSLMEQVDIRNPMSPTKKQPSIPQEDDNVPHITPSADSNIQTCSSPSSLSAIKPRTTTTVRTSKRLKLKKSHKKIIQEPEDDDTTIPESASDSDQISEQKGIGPSSALMTKTGKKRRRICYPLRGVKIWECKFCLIQVDTINNFAQHLLTHYKNFQSIKATSVVKNMEMESSNTTVVPYTCDICTVKPYNRLESIISHLRISHAEDEGKNSIEQYIKCHACSQYFDNESFYKSHECIPPSISCVICQMIFDNRTDLKYHSAEHCEKDFTCSRCSKILTNTSFAIHVRACETVGVLSSENSNESHPFGTNCCWIGCQTKELDFQSFYDHIAKHTHPFKCFKCKIRLRNPKEFKIHKCQKFQCDGCTVHGEVAFFDSIQDLKNHFLNSHPESSKTGIQCLECTLPFATREGYEKHGNCEQVVVHHYLKLNAQAQSAKTGENVVRFVCEICGATYSNMSSLKTHRSIHAVRKFICKICGKGFSRKALLRDHSHVHGEAKFSCMTCGKRVKTLKSLSVHKLIHNELKPFSCNVCGKGFAQKINLQSHLRSHLPKTEKQEICDQCGKNLSSPVHLKHHLEAHKIGKKIISSKNNLLPSKKKSSFSTKHLSKLELEQDNHENQLGLYEVSVVSSSHEMAEDLEIENEVIIVGEEESQTELTLTYDDDDTSTELNYNKSFADSDMKDENMVLLQIDDSGHYIIAFSHV